MEKQVGILNDQDGDVTKALLDGYGSVKYKIYDTSFCQPRKLAFQTNDKEVFIKEWVKRQMSVASCDDIGVSFMVDDHFGGSYMDETVLREYLDKKEKE